MQIKILSVLFTSLLVTVTLNSQESSLHHFAYEFVKVYCQLRGSQPSTKKNKKVPKDSWILLETS